MALIQSLLLGRQSASVSNNHSYLADLIPRVSAYFLALKIFGVRLMCTILNRWSLAVSWRSKSNVPSLDRSSTTTISNSGWFWLNKSGINSLKFCSSSWAHIIIDTGRACEGLFTCDLFSVTKKSVKYITCIPTATQKIMNRTSKDLRFFRQI